MSDFLFTLLAVKTIGVLGLLLAIVTIRPLVLKWLNADVAYKLWLVIPTFLLLPTNWMESSTGSSVMTFFIVLDLDPLLILLIRQLALIFLAEY